MANHCKLFPRGLFNQEVDGPDPPQARSKNAKSACNKRASRPKTYLGVKNRTPVAMQPAMIMEARRVMRLLGKSRRRSRSYWSIRYMVIRYRGTTKNAADGASRRATRRQKRNVPRTSLIEYPKTTDKARAAPSPKKEEKLALPWVGKQVVSHYIPSLRLSLGGNRSTGRSPQQRKDEQAATFQVSALQEALPSGGPSLYCTGSRSCRIKLY